MRSRVYVCKLHLCYSLSPRLFGRKMCFPHKRKVIWKVISFTKCTSNATPSTHKVIFKKKKYLFVLLSEGLGGTICDMRLAPMQYNPRTSFIRMSHLPYSKAPKNASDPSLWVLLLLQSVHYRAKYPYNLICLSRLSTFCVLTEHLPMATKKVYNVLVHTWEDHRSCQTNL